MLTTISGTEKYARSNTGLLLPCAPSANHFTVCASVHRRYNSFMGGMAFKLWTSEQYGICNNLARKIPKLGPLLTAEDCPEELKNAEKPSIQLTLNGTTVEATGKTWPLEEFMKQLLSFEKMDGIMFANHSTNEEATAKVADVIKLCATWGWQCELI